MSSLSARQHPNAPLTPEGHRRMVDCVLKPAWTVKATAVSTVASTRSSPVVGDGSIEQSESFCDPPIYLGVLVGCSYQQGLPSRGPLCRCAPLQPQSI